jgi:diadenosine tetraphosphate (Ap4A) HIT family hydrolase
MFKLHTQLAQDTIPVIALSLCQVLLMNDSRFPWLILVPQEPGLREFHNLSSNNQTQLMKEITSASRVLEQLYLPRKLNVGALGNIVEQLHIHVVARNQTDEAWPGPIWGHGTPIPYTEIELAQVCIIIEHAFNGLTGP